MIFVKTIRKDGNKTIHETLDLSHEKHLGNDRIEIYEGCCNDNKSIPITQEDLQLIFDRKKKILDNHS